MHNIFYTIVRKKLTEEDFEKIAMVGEKKWQEWMTEIMKPFTSAEIKYFSTEERDDARKWIEE